jgi:hypothetical protein
MSRVVLGILKGVYLGGIPGGILGWTTTCNDLQSAVLHVSGALQVPFRWRSPAPAELYELLDGQDQCRVAGHGIKHCQPGVAGQGVRYH